MLLPKSFHIDEVIHACLSTYFNILLFLLTKKNPFFSHVLLLPYFFPFFIIISFTKPGIQSYFKRLLCFSSLTTAVLGQRAKFVYLVLSKVKTLRIPVINSDIFFFILNFVTFIPFIVFIIILIILFYPSSI